MKSVFDSRRILLLKEEQQDMLSAVLAEFYSLDRIPRNSGQEQKVSNFLYNKLQSLGLNVVQDARGNIIADKEAACGYEQTPCVILQAHMDMVCVSENPQKNPAIYPINLLNDGLFLFGEGTSIGADDGIGIAIILFVLQHLCEHGPIRVIFTVDEERGMTGAANLADKYLLDASYLINCDSENAAELTIGCAGGVEMQLERQFSTVSAKSGFAYKIMLNGALGGHSGDKIGEGRANVIGLLALLLRDLVQNDVHSRLVCFDGGTVKNAIPDKAEAVIVTELDAASINRVLQKFQTKIKKRFAHTDPDIIVSSLLVESAVEALSSQDSRCFLDLLLSVHSGVYEISRDVVGGVKSSCNMGLVNMSKGLAEVDIYARSAADEFLADFPVSVRALADLAGFTFHREGQLPAWPSKKDGSLVKAMSDVFKSQHGIYPQIVSIHAGLECALFAAKNPALEIVSIGATTFNIHSTTERLELCTVVPQVQLIEATLQRVMQQKI